MLQVVISAVLVGGTQCVMVINLLPIYKINCIFHTSIGEIGWKQGINTSFYNCLFIFIPCLLCSSGLIKVVLS